MSKYASASQNSDHLPQITAIVFDLDGTLVDSTPGIGNALSQAFQSVGKSMPAVNLGRVIGPPITVMARRIDPLLSDEEVSCIERSYRAIYDTEGWRDTIPYPAVEETLTVLYRHHLRLFIITNKPLLPTSLILTQLDLRDLFVDAVSRDSRVPHYSSKSEMLSEVLKLHQLQPNTTLMIGDTVEDQEAAHTNNIDFLHVTYGYGSVTKTRCISHFSEIVGMLNLPSGDRERPAAKGIQSS